MARLITALSCSFIYITFLSLITQPSVRAEAEVVSPEPTAHVHNVQPRLLDEDRVSLQLCDCHPASGAPGGLSCDKEGFFIAAFERQGQWVAGGGAVPLSRAICCRPCLPDTLPSDPSGRLPSEDLQAVAVVSMGCHASIDTLGVRCEEGGGSFVSGFTDAIRVFTSTDTLYPIDTAQCCTPALLLDSGDAWELERCGCHPSDDTTYPVNCGGNTTGEALAGFDYFRLTPMGQVVPVGPAKCCGICLSRSIHPIADCADLNHCNNNGVCLMGRCECLVGWGAADCSQPIGGSGRWGGHIPPWAVALLVVGSCILAIILLSVVAHVAEAVAEAREEGRGSEDGDGVRRPLLLRIDPDDTGSVGSDDTECNDDIEEVEERIEGVIHRIEEQQLQQEAAEGAAGLGETEAEAGEGPANNGTNTSETLAATAAAQAAQGEERQGEEVEADVDVDIEAGNGAPAGSATTDARVAPSAASPSTAPEVDDEGKGALRSYAGVGPLSNVDCTVCMIRPVQTVLVPCGHVCMCRRCSRRLNRCPICRTEIVRRQRLFV